MKKVLTTVFAFALLTSLFCTTIAYAATNTYDLSALGLEVTIPSGYSVLTRDTPASDPIFGRLGTTRAALISQFESSNIYLNAISNSVNEEIVVTMVSNSISNFSLFSDTTLQTLASGLVKEYTNYGINVLDYEIYQHAQAKFIKVSFTDSANTVHGLQYYTVYDGKAMNFTMRSYTGSLSPQQEKTIQVIVDSIKYHTAPLLPDTGEDTDAFVYTDTESGVKFTVPANWKQEAFTKDREYIDVKFVSTKEAGCYIIYGSTDVWGQLSASDRAGTSRSDFNNSSLTKSDIAEVYGTTADKISVVTYNGVQYYKGETTKSSDAIGLNISVTMTQLVCIHNGWMYMFQFSGTGESKYYADFESLLNSVRYPTTAGVGAANSLRPGDVEAGNVIAITLPIIIVIGGIILIVYIRKKKAEEDDEFFYTEIGEYKPPAPPKSNSAPSLTCKNCGQVLPPDSGFCHKCGTKIRKEESSL